MPTPVKSSHRGHAAAFAKGLRTGIPICLGYFAVAFALGITCRRAGMSVIQSGAMSVGMLASAGEFAAVTLISSGAGIFEMITTTVIVNLRYVLMGAALSQKIGERTPMLHRLGLSYCITDEIFGVCISLEDGFDPFYAYGTTLISAAGWASGTMIGVVMGSALPSSVVDALSVALYGMFLAVIIPASRKDRFIAGIVAVSMACSALFAVLPILNRISSGFRVIILTVLIAGAAAFIRPVTGRGPSSEDNVSREERRQGSAGGEC